MTERNGATLRRWGVSLTMLLVVWSMSLASSVSALSETTGSSGIIDLYPEQSRDKETMPCGTMQVYHVHDLDPHKVYDVKISYPASIPTIFTIDVQQLLVNGENEPKSTRRRLNTAKLRLLPSELLRKWHATASKETQARYRLETLDSQSFVVEIAVRADVEGVSPTLDLSKRQCVFNIVVEEMLFAAFPHDTLILIAWLLFLLFVTACFVYPYVYRKISLELDEDKKITNELRTKTS